MGSRRRRLVIWIVVMGVAASALSIALAASAVTATVLVDRVPGADAGIASSAALDAAYAIMAWTFPALLAVVLIGVAVPVIAHRRTRMQ